MLRVERFGHRDIVLACALTPDGSRVVTASWDRSLRVWSLDAARAPAAMAQVSRPFSFAPSWCRVTLDGQRVVILFPKWSFQVWSLDTGELLAELAVQSPKYCEAMAVGDRRAIIQAERGLHAIDLETGHEIGTLVADGAPAWRQCRGARRPLGRLLYAEGAGDPHLGSGDLPDPHPRRGAAPRCVTTPAQRCAPLGTSIAVWDETGRLTSTFAIPDSSMCEWVATLDGRHLIISNEDCASQVRVWETATGAEIVTLVHQEPPFSSLRPNPISSPAASLAVTPDGRRVVTTSRGQSICVWDLNTGASVATIHVERAAGPVAVTNEVLCVHDCFCNMWFFELPHHR